jgi:hypothetical protein
VKLLVTQLSKKFLSFIACGGFTAMFSRALDIFISRMKPFHIPPLYLVLINFDIALLWSCPSDYFEYCDQNCLLWRSSHACYMLPQTHPSCFDGSSGGGERNVRDSGFVKDWNYRPLWVLSSCGVQFFLTFGINWSWGFGVMPGLRYRTRIPWVGGWMGPGEVPEAVLKKKRPRPPFLRSSKPWRSHQIDGAARFNKWHTVRFFVIKWKTSRSVEFSL